MTDLEVIGSTLQIDEEGADVVLQLCDWVEHQIAIEKHGYPRDNLVPRPMTERLADPEYVNRLLRSGIDQDTPAEVLDALRALHDRIAP